MRMPARVLLPRQLLALILGLTTTGCSFIWVTRPLPKEKASDEYGALSSCTSSYVTPALDTAALAFFGAAITNIALNVSSKEPALAIDGAMAATSLTSAIYGYHYVAKCKEQKPTTPMAESNVTPRSFASQPMPLLPSPVVPTIQVRGKHLAVLEFQGKNLDPDILMTFSDTVRGGALQGLEGYGVVVMTRENMLVLLRDAGKQECGEGDCEVETARNIGADYVISGKVVRIEQLYVVTLKLHETQGGSLLGTETVEGASQVELMRSLREHGRQLTSAAFGPGTDSR